MPELDDLARRVQELEAENHLLKTTLTNVTVEGLGDALDLKHSATTGHSKRVTAFAIGIARALGMPREKIAVLARGAFLHDIGKMAIPDQILKKPTKLTPDETAIMREHCLKGYQLIKKIPFLEEPSEIVYAHHERHDGTGYPRALRGEQIPLGARVVALANTLDSIMSDLPYRPASSLQSARKEIQLWSGRQFDPDVVGVFLEIPDQIWVDLRQHLRNVPQTKPNN